MPSTRLIVLVCAVFAGIIAAPVLIAKSPDAELLKLEEISGGHFCSDGGVKDGYEALDLSSTVTSEYDGQVHSIRQDSKAYRELVVSRFDTPQTACLDLTRQPAIPGFFHKGPRNSGYIEIDGRRLPLIASRYKEDSFKKRNHADANTIYVRIGGGPGSASVLGEGDALILYDDDVVSFDFHYTGHGFNSLYPKPIFKTAYTQISKFLEQLRARNPDSRIVVIGGSFGAPLSLEAIRLADSRAGSKPPVADELILVAPPFGSLNRTAKLLEQMALAEGSHDRKFQYRSRSSGEDYNSYGELLNLDGMDFLLKSYSSQEGQTPLLDRVRRVPASLPILVLYGSADFRIDQDEAKTFDAEKPDNVKMVRIEGMDHFAKPGQEFMLLQDSVDDFLFNNEGR
ncbi:MAG: alpha/beta hydrolase [Pseudomonadota bacterium]|nr:alpha/beta hydrolase [Pseudomonadota bacterium]